MTTFGAKKRDNKFSFFLLRKQNSKNWCFAEEIGNEAFDHCTVSTALNYVLVYVSIWGDSWSLATCGTLEFSFPAPAAPSSKKDSVTRFVVNHLYSLGQTINHQWKIYLTIFEEERSEQICEKITKNF